VYYNIRNRKQPERRTDMRIKKISFYSVPRKEASTCDCCGKGIQNIYFITLADDTILKLGTTCFDKQMKTKLDKMAKRKVNSALKLMRFWEEQKEKWQAMTEEEYLNSPAAYENKIGKYEGINTFEDLKKWTLEEFIPYRISCEEEEIKKYAKL
jgi:hypothetical protein